MGFETAFILSLLASAATGRRNFQTRSAGVRGEASYLFALEFEPVPGGLVRYEIAAHNLRLPGEQRSI